MLVTFDPRKNAGNCAERGIPFRLALRLDWSTALVEEDRRKDYGERRFHAVGYIDERLHVLHASAACAARDQPAQGQRQGGGEV